MGGTYEYRICSSYEDQSSSKTGKVAVNISVPTYSSQVPKPQGVKAVAVSPTEVKLTWQDVTDDEKGFLIMNAVNEDMIAITDANATSYSHTGLTPGGTYRYIVCTIQGNKISAAGDGDIVTVTLPSSAGTHSQEPSVTPGETDMTESPSPTGGEETDPTSESPEATPEQTASPEAEPADAQAGGLPPWAFAIIGAAGAGAVTAGVALALKAMKKKRPPSA